MIIDEDKESSPIEEDTTRPPTKKKSKEQTKGKKSKKQKVDSQDEEKGDDDALIFDKDEDVHSLGPPANVPASPVYVPTFSSPEAESPETIEATTQSHANVDLVTFSHLSSANVSRLRQERDRLQFGGLRRRRSLLHQLDRSTWPVLFNILQLHGRMPDAWVYENAEDLQNFKSLLSREEAITD